MTMRTFARRAVAAVAAGSAAAMLLAAWLAVWPSTSQATAAPRATTVRLTDFKVTPAANDVAAGRVRFTVRNNGGMEHEFVVIRTARRASALVVHGSQASEAGKVGEISVAMGATKNASFTLKRGHYALICNEPGHYKLGMHADLTVR